MTRTRQLTSQLAAALVVASCQTGSGVNSPPNANLDCTIPKSQILDGGVRKDGIPALENPALVGPADRGAEYLVDDDRVTGLVVDGQPIAVPLNIGWWHEIVNFDRGDHRLAVTHCPLTGSSIVFDRGPVANATFGVSGLLFMNNLIMYDRNSEESLWPQMARGARCGPKSATATALPSFPSLEITWAGWRELHPQTLVVSSQTGFGREYERRENPYLGYDHPDSPPAFPMPTRIDRRRPFKERVLGIPVDSGGIAFPFGALDQQGPVAAVHATVGGVRQVVFWDGPKQAAAAYLATAGDQALSFSVQDGAVVDAETGSTWRVDGLATAGPLAGTQLQPVAEAFVSYWFAWPAFYPSTELWTGGAP